MRRHVRSGFTLIELLLVIAVIAVLISILLPALKNARETAQSTVCMSNMAQIGKAANLYANDYKDQLWPMFDWAPLAYQVSSQPAPAVGLGVMYDYVDKAAYINECPKNKRKGINGTVNTAIDPQFGYNLGVGFDYTMIGRMQGVKLGAPITLAFLTRPEAYAATIKPVATLPDQAALTIVTGLPIFAEESTPLNNSGFTDGLWGNYDQQTRRHFQRGNVVYFEGNAAPWKVPTSRTETNTPDARDFDANDLYVTRGGANAWVRLEPANPDNRVNWGERRYGWVNGGK